MSNATESRPAARPQSNGNALQIRVDPRANEFKKILDSEGMQRSLASALPKHLSPTRMVRLALGVFQTSPKVLECTPESVLLSIMQAAFLGLEIGAGFGAEGYLVPYKGKCTFMPAYRGLCKLARQSGQVADIWAEVVYEKDEFTYELGLNQDLKHKRNDEVDNPGELKYAYAVARFKDGERKFVVMNKREVAKCRASSQSKDRDTGEPVGPWKDHPAEMWKKTAVRRLCKMLPMSVEAQTAIAREEQFEVSGQVQQLVDVELPALGLAQSSEPEDQSCDVVDQPEAEPTPWDQDQARADFAKAPSKVAVDALLKHWLPHVPEADRMQIEAWATERLEAIAATRGAKSNQQGTLV